MARGCRRVFTWSSTKGAQLGCEGLLCAAVRARVLLRGCSAEGPLLRAGVLLLVVWCGPA